MSTFLRSPAVPAIIIVPKFNPDAMNLSVVSSLSMMQYCECKGYGHIAWSDATPDSREYPSGSRSRGMQWQCRVTDTRGGVRRQLGSYRGHRKGTRGHEIVVNGRRRREIMLIEDDKLNRF